MRLLILSFVSIVQWGSIYAAGNAEPQTGEETPTGNNCPTQQEIRYCKKVTEKVHAGLCKPKGYYHPPLFNDITSQLNEEFYEDGNDFESEVQSGQYFEDQETEELTLKLAQLYNNPAVRDAGAKPDPPGTYEEDQNLRQPQPQPDTATATHWPTVEEPKSGFIKIDGLAKDGFGLGFQLRIPGSQGVPIIGRQPALVEHRGRRPRAASKEKEVLADLKRRALIKLERINSLKLPLNHEHPVLGRFLEDERDPAQAKDKNQHHGHHHFHRKDAQHIKKKHAARNEQYQHPNQGQYPPQQHTYPPPQYGRPPPQATYGPNYGHTAYPPQATYEPPPPSQYGYHQQQQPVQYPGAPHYPPPNNGGYPPQGYPQAYGPTQAPPAQYGQGQENRPHGPVFVANGKWSVVTRGPKHDRGYQSDEKEFLADSAQREEHEDELDAGGNETFGDDAGDRTAGKLPDFNDVDVYDGEQVALAKDPANVYQNGTKA